MKDFTVKEAAAWIEQERRITTTRVTIENRIAREKRYLDWFAELNGKFPRSTQAHRDLEMLT